MAYDLFAIFAIFFECKYSFSKVSYTITAWKTNPNREIIEVEETLQLWVIVDVIELFTLV